jgi:small subunit ribosomal protein S23
MKHKHLSKASAYDLARKEFYSQRHLSEIRARIAKEEAQHVGAYFGKGPLEIGMALEDKSWESWKAWATVQIEDEQASRAQMFSGAQEGEGEGVELNTSEEDVALEALAGTTSQPKPSQPRVGQGGVLAHP